MPRYRLLAADSGEDLGPIATAAGGWKQGDRIPLRAGEAYEVEVYVAPTETDDHDGYLVVRLAA
jgi:hypothetical protein